MTEDELVKKLKEKKKLYTAFDVKLSREVYRIYVWKEENSVECKAFLITTLPDIPLDIAENAVVTPFNLDSTQTTKTASCPVCKKINRFRSTEKGTTIPVDTCHHFYDIVPNGVVFYSDHTSSHNRDE